jgi:hypothetical protein
MAKTRTWHTHRTVPHLRLRSGRMSQAGNTSGIFTPHYCRHLARFGSQHAGIVRSRCNVR